MFTACSPHHVALFVQHVHGFYVNDFADRLVTLLPDWVRWLAERAAIPPEPDEHCLPYVRGQPYPQIMTDNRTGPA